MSDDRYNLLFELTNSWFSGVRFKRTTLRVAACSVLFAACTAGSGNTNVTPTANASAAGDTAMQLMESGTPSPELEGSAWRLTEYTDAQGARVSAAARTAIRFADGRITGEAGCNRMSAGYSASGTTISIRTGASTMMACPEPAMSQESAFLALLPQVGSFRIAGDELQLLSASGEMLARFERQIERALTGAAWELTGYAEGENAVRSPVAGTTITINFSEDGSVSGSAGCNTYRGSFTAEGANLKITPAGTTKKLCMTPAGVMEQESHFVTSLESVTGFTIENSMLELKAADGTLIARFRSAGS